MLESIVCRYADFSSEWYQKQEINLSLQGTVSRKIWEWCAITQVLEERDMLRSSRSGLGFAVGKEPLASHFAARGVKVLATDLDPDSDEGWIASGQHAASKEALFNDKLISKEVFDERVSYQPADMRTLHGLSAGYDFTWSSCAMEHLGGLTAGMDFVVRSSELLNPGGVAVHTTEFNVSSDTETIEAKNIVLYRRRDILELETKLQEAGLELLTPNFDVGSHQYDMEPDVYPYATTGKMHIKLKVGEHTCTSMLLVIEKP